MNIDSIKNGIVIDHITASKAMQLYNMLGLDKLDCSVAIIKNAASKKMGRKDIIKIDSSIDLDLDVLGYICPDATINIIRDGKLAEKRHIAMPEKLTNIIKCKNPRCIVTVEQGIDHIFVLADREKKEYRCLYCDTKASTETL